MHASEQHRDMRIQTLAYHFEAMIRLGLGKGPNLSVRRHVRWAAESCTLLLTI